MPPVTPRDRLKRRAVAAAVLCLSALATVRAADAPAARRLEIFAEGVISTPDDEVGITFTPDGRTAYFGKESRTTTTTPISVICVSRLDRGRWSAPEIAPFSGRWHDQAPAISPDGAHLCFSSDRPIAGRPRSASPDELDTHIWVVDRTASGWSEPRRLGPPVESASAHEEAPSPAADGTLYFSSDRPQGKGEQGIGRHRIYRARWVGGHYAPPENLAALNGPAWDSQPAIAPDQTFLVFASAGRPDALEGRGARYFRADLYVSFRAGDGWTAPRSLGPPVDSTADDSSPSLSPDGRWLYFTSERNFVSLPISPRLTARDFAAGVSGTLNGAGNIYRIDLGVVRELAAAAKAEKAARAAAPAPESPLRARSSYASEAPIPEPRLFGEGVISTPADEFGGQFTRDGLTFFFSRSVPRFYLDTIFVSHFAGGRWSAPEVAPFSGQWRDYDPVLSADGSRIFFISDRPRAGQPAKGYNIWFVEPTPAGGWSEPQDLGAPINGSGEAHFACTTLDGTLYFTSHRPGNIGYTDVYRSRRVDGRYTAPENLGPAINGKGWSNLEAYVFPEGNEMIVAAFGHEDSYGDADLFVSFWRDGAWTPLKNLGPKINSAARDYTARLTPDGRYLMFASERGLPDTRRDKPFAYRELEQAMHSTMNGLGNLYLVDVDALPQPPAP
jgi:Tol biopolymer transport system component